VELCLVEFCEHVIAAF